MTEWLNSVFSVIEKTGRKEVGYRTDRRFVLSLSHRGYTLVCCTWLGPISGCGGSCHSYAATEILWFFRGRFCILSDLERYFKGIPRPDDPLDQNFVRRLWNLLFRRDISSENAQILTRIWGRLGFTVAFARLYLSGAF